MRTELREIAKTHGKLESRSKGRETYTFNNQNLVLTFSNKIYRPTSIKIDYAGLDDKGWRDLGFRSQDDKGNVPLVTISLIDKKTGKGKKWTGPANAKIETTTAPPPPAIPGRTPITWKRNPLKKIDIKNKIKNFYAALGVVIKIGHRVLRSWDKLPLAVKARYPKQLPPLKKYLQDLTTWHQRLRTNIRIFAALSEQREQERLQQLHMNNYGKYALNNPQSVDLLKLGLALDDLDRTWKALHQHPLPRFVLENKHVELVPGAIHKQPLLRKWVNEAGESLRGKQAGMAQRVAARWLHNNTS